MIHFPARIAVLALLTLSGCSAITDFDRFGPASDVDAGEDLDGGGLDAGEDLDARVLVDGCTPMGEETCNEIDDDCDGETDENVDDDPDNCGACGFACQPVDDATPSCVAGDCVADCEAGFDDCDGVYANGCEADLTDPGSCTSCTEVCGSGDVCTATGCASECPDDEEVCGLSCIDTMTSTAHCGSCESPCLDRPGSAVTCEAGDCVYTCTTGFGDCDLDPATGCEVELNTVVDCGTCGMACPDPMSATASCSGSADCEFSCDSGFANCDAIPGNGCEADLNSNSTCGNCTRSCTGATPLCDSGTCVSGCMSPTPTPCAGSCVNTDTDILHCGACGMVCPTRAHSSPTCAPVAGVGTCDFSCDTGWSDCDGDPANGCEEFLRTYYRDMDDDLYGTSVSMEFCAASAPSGWVLMTGDCEDTDSSVNPGMGELCNGIDDNCVGGADEGFMVGATCACEVGADSGTIRCDSPTSSSCTYPAESCNGLDDDCDGSPDNGFDCVFGSSQTCSGTVLSCNYIGTQTCSSTCSQGTCLPPNETCNGVDDNCDGFADEGLLAPGPAITVGTYSTSGGSIFPNEPTVRWSPTTNRAGAVWGSRTGPSNYEMIFVELDATGSPIGPQVVAATITTGPEDLNVGWDGSAWAIFWKEGASGPLRVARVAAGGVVTPAMQYPSAMTGSTRRLATAMGPTGVAVVWASSGPEYLSSVFSNGSAGPSTQLYTTNFSALGRPAVVSIGGGDYATLYRHASGDQLRWQRFDSGGPIGSAVTLFTDSQQEVNQRLAYDSVSGNVLLTWDVLGGGVGSSRRQAASVSPFGLIGTPTVSTDIAQPAAGGDGTFLVVNYSTNSPARARAADGEAYPETIPYSSGSTSVTGMAGAAADYMVLRVMGNSGIIEGYVFSCM